MCDSITDRFFRALSLRTKHFARLYLSFNKQYCTKKNLYSTLIKNLLCFKTPVNISKYIFKVWLKQNILNIKTITIWSKNVGYIIYFHETNTSETFEKCEQLLKKKECFRQNIRNVKKFLGKLVNLKSY